MLRATMKYGAVSAKVMALYGRLLSTEEWRKLCDCSSVGDIILFLKNHSGWSDVFSSTSPNAGVEAVSEAAESALWKEYEKLYKFAYLEDKRFLDFFLFRAEMEHILSALGRLCSAGDKGVKTNVSDFIIKHSSVNSEQLDSSTDFKGLQEAIKGSIFEQPLTLLPINKESGLPDYPKPSEQKNLRLYGVWQFPLPTVLVYCNISQHGIGMTRRTGCLPGKGLIASGMQTPQVM